MDLNLAGRRVLVVGGSGVIGTAVAARFLDEGASVVIAGRTRSRLESTVAQLQRRGAPGHLGSVELDSTNAESVSAGVVDAVSQLGGLDVLVNSGAPAAGSVIADAAGRDEIAEVQGAIDTKALGYLRCARAVQAHLLESGAGAVVNVCGQHVHLSQAMTATLRNASVAGMTKVLADELAGKGVTVNVVHPGPVLELPLTEPGAAEEHPPFAAPGVGEPGETTPGQVAALVAFLASPWATSISGASIDVGHRILGSSFM